MKKLSPLLIVSSFLVLTPIVFAQTTSSSSPMSETIVDSDDDSGKWGLAGLLGLLGLLGLKRHDHDSHRSTTTNNR